VAECRYCVNRYAVLMDLLGSLRCAVDVQQNLDSAKLYVRLAKSEAKTLERERCISSETARKMVYTLNKAEEEAERGRWSESGSYVGGAIYGAHTAVEHEVVKKCVRKGGRHG